jgi:hypothetical protein
MTHETVNRPSIGSIFVKNLIVCWILLFGLLSGVSAVAATLSENQKIDALIHSIEVLPGAHFIRNGKSYDGAAAADHLRMKRRYGGSRIKTANDFITNCASRSSMSGEPYRIQLANGSTITAESFFRAKLKRIETSSADFPIVAPD